MKFLKYSLFLYLVFISFKLTGATVSFVGPCDEAPLLEQDVDIQGDLTVGQLTIDVLDQLNISYIGSERGVHSIFDTPIGDQALVIIDELEMLAYGWCYSINGVAPEKYPHEVYVSHYDNIVWWFGYAHYFNGEWVEQCVPAYTRTPSQFCED